MIASRRTPTRSAARRGAVRTAAATVIAALVTAGCHRTGAGPDGPGRAALDAPARTFANPIVDREAGDPWVVRHAGRYYFTATLDPDGGVWVWESPTLTGLGAPERRVRVWTAPATGPTSRQIWAPELHRLGGRWYLYFTASDGVDAHHRHYVLAARTDDPLGAYEPPARVDPGLEHYAIDGSVLATPDGRLYWMYCTDGPENGVYLAPMRDPAHVDPSAPRVRIVAGSEAWEHGWRRVAGRWTPDAGYWVEAPEALVHGGRVFVAYSAGHTATPHYYLGLVALAPGGDPMDPRAWTKHRAPVLAPYAGTDGRVFTPGHNSFTTSPDGTEDWLVYHAKDEPPDSTGGNERGVRTVRAQRVAWAADGTPSFGHPIPRGVAQRRPSGE